MCHSVRQRVSEEVRSFPAEELDKQCFGLAEIVLCFITPYQCDQHQYSYVNQRADRDYRRYCQFKGELNCFVSCAVLK